MPSYVLKRLLASIPTLFAIVAISFFLIRFAPGGPFDVEQQLDEVVLQNLNRHFGLDQPLHVQFGMYLRAAVRGDFGPSFILRDFTVAELIARGLPISVTIGFLSLALAVVVGVVLGAAAAFRQNRAADYSVMVFATAGVTIPTFVVGPILQIVFGLWLAWLPVGGWNDGAIRNVVMPVVVLALPQLAVVARLTRAAMIETLRANHIRTLRSQGLPTSTIARHALRGALLPVISYLGPAAAALLTGSIVVENIFSLPGVGRYFVEGALNRDYTLVMGTVVLVAVFVLVFNLLVDILYAVVDPRVRYE
jgi:oligopeptide transport system permease protein